MNWFFQDRSVSFYSVKKDVSFCVLPSVDPQRNSRVKKWSDFLFYVSIPKWDEWSVTKSGFTFMTTCFVFCFLYHLVCGAFINNNMLKGINDKAFFPSSILFSIVRCLLFLVACTRLYKSLCQSVGRSVCLSVGLSVCQKNYTPLEWHLWSNLRKWNYSGTYFDYATIAGAYCFPSLFFKPSLMHTAFFVTA